jgi:hypothetical protein
MKKPTYDELLEVVTSIASFIADGDGAVKPGDDGLCPCGCGSDEHEMTIDEAFETASSCISMCRDVLGTDGSDLPICKPNEEFKTYK